MYETSADGVRVELVPIWLGLFGCRSVAAFYDTGCL